ncbi:MAG: hypothetical protein PHP06_06025 [Clostridia bacterium]|nr:hypothetical protein [Clostridia bacterium]
MKNHISRYCFALLLVLVIAFIPTVYARTETGTKIDRYQYGEVLGKAGYGNILYNTTYDDGVYILQNVNQKQIPFLNLYGDGSPADIKIATSTRTYSSKYNYVIMNCVSEVYYQHGAITRSSYGCGDEMIRDYEFSEDRYNIFKNNLVQRVLNTNFQPAVDRVFVNGIIVVQPAAPTPTPTPIITPRTTPAKGATVNFIISPLPVTMTVSSIGTINILGSPHGFTLITGTYTYTIEKPGYQSISGSFISAVGVPDTKIIVLQPIMKPRPDIISPSLANFLTPLMDWLKSIGVL